MVAMTTDQAVPTSTDDTAVREVVSRAAAAQDDPAALLDLHTHDAVVVNIAGRRVLGRDAFAEAMQAALASPLRDVRTSVDVVDVRFPAADVAVVSTVKTVHDGRSEVDRTELPEQGAMMYTMVRTDDGWRIALAQTTPIRG